MTTARVDEVRRRLAGLRERLDRLGASTVEVVAVTKGHGPWAVEAAHEVGLRDLGENYAQELVAKAEEVPSAWGVRWHAIGTVQRNKVKRLAPHVHLWQSVDRLSLGRELASRAPGAAVLVQVNISGEPQKAGCAPSEVEDLVVALTSSGLDVRGLMGVGPTGPPEAARAPFEGLVALADALGLPVRSIGMSHDLEVAVAAGATMIRIGTDLFGPRPVPGGAGRSG